MDQIAGIFKTLAGNFDRTRKRRQRVWQHALQRQVRRGLLSPHVGGVIFRKHSDHKMFTVKPKGTSYDFEWKLSSPKVFNESGRIVGNDRVDSGGDQAIPILRFVGRPRNHGKSGGVRFAHLLRGY